jgi:Family of unknown function (DUF6069)
MSATAVRTAQSGFGRLLIVGLVVGVVAALVNLVIFFIGSATGVPFAVVMDPSQPAQALNAGMFIGASLVPALAGAVFYGLLGRFTRRASTIFLVVAVVFALLSLLGPLTMPVPLATRLMLSLLHLLTAAIIAGGLLRFANQR